MAAYAVAGVAVFAIAFVALCSALGASPILGSIQTRCSFPWSSTKTPSTFC